jgi:hypothetical protein
LMKFTISIFIASPLTSMAIPLINRTSHGHDQNVAHVERIIKPNIPRIMVG